MTKEELVRQAAKCLPSKVTTVKEEKAFIEGFEIGAKWMQWKMKASDWIKVTDKLPEEGSTVVICLKKMHIAYLIYYKQGFKIDGKIIPNDDVLCWVEIVPPPSDYDKK